MMNMYVYTAILYKTMVTQGKVTFTDKRVQSATMEIPLDSVCVTGHVLGQTRDEAKQHAISLVKREYPEEQGYKHHDNIVVREVSE